MKSAVWLYLFLFVAFFDLHAQYPILTPFAVSLGAAPSFVGLVMGMYALTHLPGNLLAGYGVDRFGSRLFIAASLTAAGVLLIVQSRITNPWHLLYIRSVSGFVIAFLSPACLALLARMARDRIWQGKLMAANGIIHTVASVISPAAGAWLAVRVGFSRAFETLGWLLMITGVLALWIIREPVRLPQAAAIAAAEPRSETPSGVAPLRGAARGAKFPWSVMALPVALACAQGILAFELPFAAGTAGEEVMRTGWLFTIISIGALVTLSLLSLQRILPYARTVAGAAAMAFCFYLLASGDSAPMMIVVLFLLGMAKGVVLPAMNTFLLQLSGSSRYGRTFSALSIAMSIGSFLGPLLAGNIRELWSPFFFAFLILMLALLALAPRPLFITGWRDRTSVPPTSG
jgi:MFS family permease